MARRPSPRSPVSPFPTGLVGAIDVGLLPQDKVGRVRALMAAGAKSPWSATE